MKIERLKMGDRIVVRNGARGEQVAVVSSVTRNGTARAHKWLMRGRRWTNPVTLYAPDVLRFATPGDFAIRRVTATAPIGKAR